MDAIPRSATACALTIEGGIPFGPDSGWAAGGVLGASLVVSLVVLGAVEAETWNVD